MIEPRNDTNEPSFENQGNFLAPSAPEQDVVWLDENEVRNSITESFPNELVPAENYTATTTTHKGVAVIDLASRKLDSFTDRNPSELYSAEKLVGLEIEEMRRYAA